ncbi:UNVERIFIED_CONTAM: hypothetical protein Sradi_5270200 [Sesamum radiatum]|uniref:Epoxide hydrolase n=1 Tax=Sesamum radiatum TaxID=300843 RepID=A0AAW2LLC3_SESRA
MIAWNFCLMRPDRIKALVNTSIVFQPRNPAVQPIQRYRALLGDGFYMSWELSSSWTGSQIKVPVKFLIGDLDLTYHFPGVKEYIDNGDFKKYVPLLETVVVMEGVAHFLNQERPEEVSEHIYDFIKKF